MPWWGWLIVGFAMLAVVYAAFVVALAMTPTNRRR
jgi:hypothetical protein